MVKHTQSKVVVKNAAGEMVVRGNCFQTTVACMIDTEPTEVPNVETLFDIEGGLWYEVMSAWLKSKGWELCTDTRYKVFHDPEYKAGYRDEIIKEIQDTYYMVSGKSTRGVMHCCIYCNGLMVWDCHPTHEGLETVEYFETITKIK